MYWWNVARLREELKLNVVTEREKMKYVLAHFIVVGIITSDLPGVENISSLITLGDVVSLVITVFGILCCYGANRSGDGQRFVERFICIGWPISIRVLIYLLPATLVFLLLLPFDLAVAAIVIAETTWNFLWIRSELLKISGARES